MTRSGLGEISSDTWKQPNTGKQVPFDPSKPPLFTGDKIPSVEEMRGAIITYADDVAFKKKAAKALQAAIPEARLFKVPATGSIESIDGNEDAANLPTFQDLSLVRSVMDSSRKVINIGGFWGNAITAAYAPASRDVAGKPHVWSHVVGHDRRSTGDPTDPVLPLVGSREATGWATLSNHQMSEDQDEREFIKNVDHPHVLHDRMGALRTVRNAGKKLRANASDYARKRLKEVPEDQVVMFVMPVGRHKTTKDDGTVTDTWSGDVASESMPKIIDAALRKMGGGGSLMASLGKNKLALGLAGATGVGIVGWIMSRA